MQIVVKMLKSYVATVCYTFTIDKIITVLFNLRLKGVVPMAPHFNFNDIDTFAIFIIFKKH